MPPRHFTDISDLSRDDLDRVLEEARHVGNARKTGIRPAIGPMTGKLAAFVSSKESLRTTGSIHAASTYLGGSSKDFTGHALFDETGQPRERFEDITRNLEVIGYSVIFARLHHHRDLLQMTLAAKQASVINALTDASHPLQALADAQAFRLERPDTHHPTVVFFGAGNNVATSLGEVSAMLGWNFVHSGPLDEKRIPPKRWESMQRLAAAYGGSVRYEPDPHRAADGADYVYTDVHASMGEKADAMHLKALLQPYKVTAALMERAKPDAVFGHCLPAERGVEVDPEVIDGPQSITTTIARCRTDTTAAVMKLVLRDR